MLWGDTGGAFPTGPTFCRLIRPDTPIEATVNGRAISAPGIGKTLALAARGSGADRHERGLRRGECGACTVYLDGMWPLWPVSFLAARAHGARSSPSRGWPATTGCTRSARLRQDRAVQWLLHPRLSDGRGQAAGRKAAPDSMQIGQRSPATVPLHGYYKIIEAVHEAAGETSQ
jgi:hypothetical protein